MVSGSLGAVLSADDHLQEPKDLWQDRLPTRLRDRAPRLVRLPDGSDAFEIAGQPARKLDILVSAGQTKEEKSRGRAVTWDDIRPGFYEPAARLADMAVDGVGATVLYPNVFLDLVMNQITLDPDVYRPAIEVYNDHMAEFCAHDPARLLGAGIVPTDSPESGVREIERLATLPGIRGALLPIEPTAGPDWHAEEWDPLFRAAAAAGLVLSIHSGKNRGLPRRGELAARRGGMATYMHIGPLSTAETFAQIMWAGQFDRNPDLRMVSVEGGIGWVAFWKWRATDVCERHGGWLGLTTSPAEWIGRNLFFTFEQDPAGIATLDLIGVDAVMWAADYPHTATTWPHSLQAIEHEFGGLPDDARARIVGGNMARLYGLTR
jgi:predicted TIM-barrel fold metal-dependent hydrolase